METNLNPNTNTNTMETTTNTSLEYLYNDARNAYLWTSFDPEIRGRDLIKNYELMLSEDLEDVPESYHDEYVDKFKRWVVAVIYKKSKTASTMIAGGANFNTRRNDKAMESYSRTIDSFNDWRKKFNRMVTKREVAKIPPEMKNDIRLEELKTYAREMSRNFERPLFYDRCARLACKGEVEILRSLIEYVRSENAKRDRKIYTENHKFFKLVELAESWREHIGLSSDTTPITIPFEGGSLVKNKEADRLQILFDTKPSADMIAKLKKGAFRWAPSTGTWQRQLTYNALVAASKIIPLTIDEIKNN